MQAGQTVGPYTLVERIGRGGMASVFRAYEAALDRHVALKILPRELLDRSGFKERFAREAKLIARLEHPNIVPLYAFGIDDDVPWMALRLVAGGHLGERLDASPLPIDPGLRMFRMIASALDHAHANAVVHRDLKPQNVLLGERGEIYLADFGVARLLEESTALTQTGNAIGTPQYMAPEQAKGEVVGPAADIYALGVMVYRWLGGALPFDADTPYAVMYKHVSSPLPLEPLAALPPRARAAIGTALAKSPAERWPTATGFIAELGEGLQSVSGPPAGVPPAALGTPDAARATHPQSTSSVENHESHRAVPAMIVGTLAVVAVGALAIGVWSTRPPGDEVSSVPNSPSHVGASAPSRADDRADPSSSRPSTDTQVDTHPELVIGDTRAGKLPDASPASSRGCAPEFFHYRSVRMQGTSDGKPVTMEWQWTGAQMGLITLFVQGGATRIPYSCRNGKVVAAEGDSDSRMLQSLDVGTESGDGSLRVVGREAWAVGPTTVETAIVQRKDATGSSRLRMLIGAPILLEDSAHAWKAEQLKIDER